MSRRLHLPAAIAVSLLTLLACSQAGLEPFGPLPTATLLENAELVAAKKSIDVRRCAFGQQFSLESENDFFPISVGSQWIYTGDDDGEFVELHITVLDEIEVVGGVRTRVIEEREWKDGELFESARNYFAETEDETVCYFGEAVDFYENGEIISHEGSWRADKSGNAPGIIMPAEPRKGVTFQMEVAPGVAMDMGEVVGSPRVKTPAGVFRKTVRIKETNPLDGGIGFKVFAEDVGMVTDDVLQLIRYRVAGDRERDNN